MNIRYIHFVLIALILMCLSAGALAETEIGHEPFDISELYIFEPYDVGDDTIELESNAAYVEKIRSLTQPCDAQLETQTLLFHAETMLVMDDMTAFTWSVQNKTDQPLYIVADAENMNYRNIIYDLFGGFNWNNYVIQPGETLHARFRGWLWEHAEPGDGTFCMPLTVYSVPEGVSPEFDDGSEVYYDRSKLVPAEETALVFSAEMQESEECIAAGLPLEVEFENYSIRVTQAVLKDISAEFTYERIYATEEAALSDSPSGYESYWGYVFNCDGDTHWIHAGFGSIPDYPVQIDDGRWAWQITYKVYSMFAQPDEIELTPYAYTPQDGMSYLPDEALSIQFESM